MSIIKTSDISIYKNNQWYSLNDSNVYNNNTWKRFGGGCGVAYNGDWYVLPPQFKISWIQGESSNVDNVAVPYFSHDVRGPSSGYIEEGVTPFYIGVWFPTALPVNTPIKLCLEIDADIPTLSFDGHLIGISPQQWDISNVNNKFTFNLIYYQTPVPGESLGYTFTMTLSDGTSFNGKLGLIIYPS